MYTAPNGNAVNFELILYTAPLGSAVTFEFTPDATATPSVQTLTLATASPSVVIDISNTPNVQALTVETYTVEVLFGATSEAGVLAGTFETYGVTVSIPDTTAYPNEITTTLATLTPTIQFDYVTTIGQTVDGILATNSVTLILDAVIQAGTQTISFVQITPEVLLDVVIAVTTQETTLQQQSAQAVIGYTVFASEETLTLELLEEMTLTGVTTEVGVQEAELTLYAGTYYAVGYFDKFESQSDTYQLKY